MYFLSLVPKLWRYAFMILFLLVPCSLKSQEIRTDQSLIKEYVTFKYVNKYEILVESHIPFDLILRIGNEDMKLEGFSQKIIYTQESIDSKKRTYHQKIRIPNFRKNDLVQMTLPDESLTIVLERLKGKIRGAVRRLERENSGIRAENISRDILSEFLGSLSPDPDIQRVTVEEEPGNTYQRDETLSEYFNRTATFGAFKTIGQLFLASGREKEYTKKDFDAAIRRAQKEYEEERKYLTEYFALTKKNIHGREFKPRITNKINRYKGYSPISEFLFEATGSFTPVEDEQYVLSRSFNISLGLTPEFTLSNTMTSRIYAVVSAGSYDFNFKQGNSELYTQTTAGAFEKISDSIRIGARYNAFRVGFGQLFTPKSRSWFFGYQQLFNISTGSAEISEFEVSNNNSAESKELIFNNDSFLDNSTTRVFIGLRFGKKKGWGAYLSGAATYNNISTQDDFRVFLPDGTGTFVQAPTLEDKDIRLTVGFGLNFSIIR